jgi:hypothetical protein
MYQEAVINLELIGLQLGLPSHYRLGKKTTGVNLLCLFLGRYGVVFVRVRAALSLIKPLGFADARAAPTTSSGIPTSDRCVAYIRVSGWSAYLDLVGDDPGAAHVPHAGDAYLVRWNGWSPEHRYIWYISVVGAWWLYAIHRHQFFLPDYLNKFALTLTIHNALLDTIHSGTHS